MSVPEFCIKNVLGIYEYLIILMHNLYIDQEATVQTELGGTEFKSPNVPDEAACLF